MMISSHIGQDQHSRQLTNVSVHQQLNTKIQKECSIPNLYTKRISSKNIHRTTKPHLCTDA